MIRLTKRLLRSLWLLLIGLTLAAGLSFAVARLLLPHADGLRAQLENRASAMLGHAVEIGWISAEMRGFGPELVLHNLAVLGEGGAPLLEVELLGVDVGLLDSLRARALSPSRVRLAGARLTLRRQIDGVLSIPGLEALQRGGGLGGGWMAPPREVRLSESRVRFDDRWDAAAKPQRLVITQARFRSDGQRHQADAELRMESGLLSLSADIRGPLALPLHWRGELYARASMIPIGALLGPYLPAGYAVDQGAGGLEAWASLEHGRLTALQGQAGAEALRLRRRFPGTDDERLLNLDGVSGRLRWRRLEHGWRFDVEDVALWRHGVWQAPEGLGVAGRYAEAAGALDLAAAADSLPVADLVRLAVFAPGLDAARLKALEALDPRGLLVNPRLHLKGSAGAHDWALWAGMDPLHIAPLGRVPGISNLRGELFASPDGVELDLRSENLAVEFAELFREPLRFRRVTGSLTLARRAEGGWRLRAPDLRAENADLRTRTRMRLEIPADAAASPVLDLQARFDRGDISAVRNYLPTGIMHPRLVAWLDRGILSGRVTEGVCVVRGPLRDFAFSRTRSGRFEAAFEVEDMRLHYQDGWPELREIAGRARFVNNRFEADITQARIYDTRVEDLRARIEDLARGSAVRIEGRARGPLGDQLRLLGETPLRNRLGPLAERLRGAGPSLLDLDLAVPLRKGDGYRLNGRVGLRNSSLTLAEHDLRLDALDGDIRFDLKGVQGEGIRGRLFDVPLTLALHSLPEQGNATRLTLTGEASAEALRARFPRLGLDFASGAAPLAVQVEVPPLDAAAAAPVRLQVASDLRGLALDLPPPLGKTAQQRRALELELEVAPDRLPLRLRYGELVRAGLLLRSAANGDSELAGAELRFGGGSVAVPAEPGLVVQGELPELDLDAWLARGGQDPAAGAWPAIRRVALDLGRVRLGGQDYRGLSLRTEPLAAGLRWHLLSDRLEARVDWTGREAPVEVRAKHWDLRLAPEDDRPERPAQGVPPPPYSGQDPRDLPAFDLVLERLNINGHPFGRLELEASRVGAGLAVQRISLRGAPLTVDGSGHWLATGAPGETRLQLAMQTPGVGGLLQKLGFAVGVDKAPAEATLDLTWPGGPQDWRLARAAGELSFEVGSGSLLEARPGIGRVFGLLNLGAIQRRLRLDFSDLLSKGLGFESMQGRFTLADGVAVTEGVAIEGPAVKIGITGQTDLIHRTFDQTAIVVANLSSSLPIAGAIAGGPAVGAALFLAQKMIGDDVDNLSATRYRITGPWAEPDVVQIDKPAAVRADAGPQP